ncbi:unnamed protein product [Kuraishia capsulata CBS 1993]|uniref:SUZ domain-containing protein n=1 Tax=Kuraishia capsulata CBS 1993 TaxID=1382522 RepID=W6MIH7_9ASCO|nr:uncharacterized protein KUCA_T00001922001 [Kuraishia capsulata CBS 1993]CDK25951.1 unnamed protein product [Kuraishia capsulata CBS 1993]
MADRWSDDWDLPAKVDGTASTKNKWGDSWDDAEITQGKSPGSKLNVELQKIPGANSMDAYYAKPKTPVVLKRVSPVVPEPANRTVAKVSLEQSQRDKEKLYEEKRRQIFAQKR